MRTRNFIGKWRNINQEEIDQQSAEMGTVHREQALQEIKQSAHQMYKSLKERYDNGERDAFMEDTTIGLRLEKVAPAEHHEDRYKRLAELNVKWQGVMDKMARLPAGTPEFDKLNAERQTLERQM